MSGQPIFPSPDKAATVSLVLPRHVNARAAPAALRATKVVHTVVWAFFAGCIVAIPVASRRGEHRVAARLAAVVLAEVAVLAVNRGRCPLTSVAARYTDDRRENFDVFLPLGVAKYNKLIFGALYFAGTGYALARWARASS